MKYEDLLRYVYTIRQMETIVYEQQEAIKKLTETANSLGHEQFFDKPQKIKTEFNFEEVFGAFAFIIGIVAAIVMFIRNQKTVGEIPILDTLASVLYGLFWGAVIGVVGGLVVALIFAIISWLIRKGIDSSYNKKEESYYRQEVRADHERVTAELAQKQYVLQEIEQLKEKHADSMKKLNHYYSFNIIDQAYRHDIVAIYMLYHYLCTQQTFSLTRDNVTGDVGAYRLYQNDIMMGMIISKLDIIIEKLDEIAEIQRDIKAAIYEVNANIDRLNDAVVNGSRRIEKAINQQTAVEAYNGQVMKRELEWGNTINWLNYVENTKRR